MGKETVTQTQVVQSPRRINPRKNILRSIVNKMIKIKGKEKILKAAAAAKLLQSCLTLCNLIDGSPPGSTIPGILQARTLEWVAISFSNAWKW